MTWPHRLWLQDLPWHWLWVSSRLLAWPELPHWSSLEKSWRPVVERGRRGSWLAWQKSSSAWCSRLSNIIYWPWLPKCLWTCVWEPLLCPPEVSVEKFVETVSKKTLEIKYSVCFSIEVRGIISWNRSFSVFWDICKLWWMFVVNIHQYSPKSVDISKEHAAIMEPNLLLYMGLVAKHALANRKKIFNTLTLTSFCCLNLFFLWGNLSSFLGLVKPTRLTLRPKTNVFSVACSCNQFTKAHQLMF